MSMATAATAATVSAGLVLAYRPPCLCSTSAAEDLALSADDEDLLLSVLDAGMRTLRGWSQEPASWWDESKVVKLSDLQDAVHCAKRMEGFPVRLHMVSAVWDDTSLDELLLLTEVSEKCLKLSFDPALDSIVTRKHVGRKGPKARLIRTITKPMLLGLISAREVDSLVRDPAAQPDGSILGGSLGLQSPLLVEKIRQKDALKTLSSAPPTPGRIRAIDHTSGYIFEPMDAGARSGSGVRGKWKVYSIFLSEAGGGVPTWAAEKGVAKAIEDWFVCARKQQHLLRNR
ncbi:unnamed protein product [Symbiodinium sp. CCMP2456]|nr:unnamed protein product [Symbiodinium sp. CCMP2456]